MKEVKEVPFNDDEDLSKNKADDAPEATPEELEKRSTEISSSIFKRLGIIIMILSLTILPLTIMTFFFHPGQPDPTSLLIQQIAGFILFAVGATIGSLLFVNARKMKKREEYILEAIVVESVENE